MQNAQDIQNGNVPNIAEGRAGWYPRWWLLAAFCYCITLITLMLLWTPVICAVRQHQSRPVVCEASNWPTIAKIPLFWLIFGAFWLLFRVVGIRFEVPQLGENPVGNFLRMLSQFSALHLMLVLQGIIALILIIVMWCLDHSPPAAFATLSIVVFLAHCSFFYRIPRANRLDYLVVYGVFALIFLLVEVLFKPNFWTHLPPPSDEQPLLCGEVMLFVIGVSALWTRWRRPARYPTAQAARDAHIDQAMQPLNILRNIGPFGRLFPQRPPQVAIDDDDDTLPGNLDPGAP